MDEPLTLKPNPNPITLTLQVNTGGPNDMLALLPSLVTPRDFVVLKFDVDPNRFAQVTLPLTFALALSLALTLALLHLPLPTQGPTMEWGFLYNLCNNPEVH